MPLTATVNGEEVVATRTPADAWAAFRGRRPWPVLSCGADAYAKTSHLGTQFFAHAADCDTDHKGESAEHLRVKAAIIAAATALGWTARAEVPADGRRWIADVLAERDGRRVAFEVQLSGQVEGGYQHRQQRYAAEGIECYWLTRRARPAELRSVPAVHLRIADDGITIADRQRSTDRRPLEQFIAAVLTGDLRWVPEADARQDATVRWGMHRCTGCDQYSVTWDADERGALRCDRCLITSDGRTLPGVGEPRRFKAARGVAAPSASYRTGRYGELEFRCPNCPTVLPTLTAAGNDYVHDVATLEPAPLHAHWCAPAAALTTPADVLRYLDGERHHAEPLTADPRTVDELTASADRRYSAVKAAAAVREAQEFARAQSARWIADRMAEAVVAAEANPSRRGDVSATFLDDVRARAEEEALQAYLVTSGKTSPDDPIPPWWGPVPRDAHQRTAALDEYTRKHLRVVDDLVTVFPPMTPECICHACRTIHHEFDRHQRQLLWPERNRGRILSPG
ncbi:competence protein CoiA family protein [Curtobacterium citreum]